MYCIYNSAMLSTIILIDYGHEDVAQTTKDFKETYVKWVAYVSNAE